jgi:nicotinamidase-related amidase
MPEPAQSLDPLIVIDLQTGMFDGAEMSPIHDAGRLVASVREALGWARANGRPVAFVRHDAEPGDALAPGAAGWPVWPALGQAADEPTFGKSIGDAFSNPKFAAWVEATGARGVVLAGAQSDFCVAATAAGALARGLKVTVVADAHSTWGSDGESAQQIIDRKNREFAAAGAALATVVALTDG